MSDKIIFLDVDGVLQSQRSAVAFDGISFDTDDDPIKFLDPVAMKLLQRFSNDFKDEVSFVLSSTWRTGIDFKTLGEFLKLPIIDATAPGLKAESLSQYIFNAELNLKDFAIIDDVNLKIFDDVGYNDPITLANQIKVDSEVGLTVDNLTDTAKILGLVWKPRKWCF